MAFHAAAAVWRSVASAALEAMTWSSRRVERGDVVVAGLEDPDVPDPLSGRG